MKRLPTALAVLAMVCAFLACNGSFQTTIDALEAAERRAASQPDPEPKKKLFIYHGRAIAGPVDRTIDVELGIVCYSRTEALHCMQIPYNPCKFEED
jgi:hypothetical protein